MRSPSLLVWLPSFLPLLSFVSHFSTSSQGKFLLSDFYRHGRAGTEEMHCPAYILMHCTALQMREMRRSSRKQNIRMFHNKLLRIRCSAAAASSTVSIFKNRRVSWRVKKDKNKSASLQARSSLFFLLFIPLFSLRQGIAHFSLSLSHLLLRLIDRKRLSPSSSFLYLNDSIRCCQGIVT